MRVGPGHDRARDNCLSGVTSNLIKRKRRKKNREGNSGKQETTEIIQG